MQKEHILAFAQCPPSGIFGDFPANRMFMVLANPTYTVYDCKLDEIPAQTTVYTPYVYGSSRTYIHRA
jgi:hypothetical protein